MMDANISRTLRLRVEKTAENLRKNGFEVQILEHATDVVPVLREIIPDGAVVAHGGSMSLAECGVMELLRSGPYQYLDRDRAGITPEERLECMRQALLSDVYLASANALIESGMIYNVDGNGNRVAALAFGPKEVILVVGYNKIVEDLHEAHRRLRHLAAPANTKRLNRNTPCAKTGICADCHSPERICCTYTVQRFSKTPGRIKVILVAEPLGY